MPIDTSALTPQEQITSLYISYYNRAPDPLGLEFWTGQLDAGQSLEDIATTFAGAAETQQAFPGIADPNPSAADADTFVTSIYNNLFGRTPDQDGLDFWSDQLTSGSTPVGQILLEFIEGARDDAAAGTDDETTVRNKIDVGADWAASAAAADIGTTEGSALAVDNGDGTFTVNNQAAFDSASTILDNVTGDPATVTAAKEATAAFTGGAAGAPTELGAALGALSDAQDARTEFLETDALANGGVAELAGDGAETAAEADVTNHYNDASLNVDGALGAVAGGDFTLNNFADRSANVQDAAIADGVAQAQQNVADAEEAVADGVLPALDTLQAREATLEEAIAAEATAEQTFLGELARFNQVNADDITPVIADPNNLLADGDTLELGGATIATLVDGSWEADTNFDFGAVGATAQSFDDLNGLDALVADGNAFASAVTAMADADTALTEAADAIVQLEQDDELAAAAPGAIAGDPPNGTVAAGADVDVTVDLTADAPDAQDVLDARGIQDDLTEEVETFEAARALNDELAALNDAIDDADAALTNGEDDDPAGLGVTLLEGADNFTAEDDVYLFNAEDSDGQTLADFGAEGEDTIFFGDGFSLVQIPDGSTINDNVGDVAALEILWEQDGDDLVLYVEGETFGGNSSGVEDVTEVTLTGVSATDITFGGGFLSAGADTVA